MPEVITNEDAQYALELVKRICTEVGPGIPGSVQERQRAAIIQQELESHLAAEHVAVEAFTFAPGASLGSMPLSGICILIAALLNVSIGRVAGISDWLATLAAVVFSILSWTLVIGEFARSHELIDPLFKKAQSVNVVGRLGKPGSTEVKRLLILSGHHDSAPANTWLRLLGGVSLVAAAIAFLGMFTMLAASIVQLAGMILGDVRIVAFGRLSWLLLIFPILPSIVYAMFFTSAHKNTVPGAADNLSACGLVVALCRFLVKNPSYIPPDTEIRFITFGAEEAGLRGSRRYVARHLEELQRLDVRLLNFETIAHPEIGILTSDISGTVPNSPELVKSAAAAGERAGIPYKVEGGFFGAITDAGPFSRVGLKATTLMPFKVPEQMVAFYHQEADSPDILTLEPFLNVLKLSLEWIRCGGG